MSEQDIPPDLQRRIDKQLASGTYRSKAEVLRDALDALDDRNAESQTTGSRPCVIENSQVRALSDLLEGGFLE